ncbi:uncharacterized protein LOC143788792 [Ranitomeya variabilis]|uniref:uncharacterized protein LOC143788792 n=1 Tax=Ranitomeya variabilis TaxID=490064 RepID=UPI004055BE04
MARALVISLFAAMCLMCIPEVLTEDCAPHVDENLRVVNSQTCILSSCGGTCVHRYCIIGGSLDQTQVLCILNNLYFIIGASIVVSLLVIASGIACCCKMCLLATAANSLI